VEEDPFGSKLPPFAQVVGEHEAVALRGFAGAPVTLKVIYVNQ
jgi:hypothetical protein